MVERQTAKKCRVNDILNGNFIQREGWEPSYFETEVGEVSRANIMAVVVATEDQVLVIDDGSGRISVRSFGEPSLEGFDVGNKVLVIGRPRVYNDEPYIAAEIVHRINNDMWLEHRKIELNALPKIKIEKRERIKVSAKVEEVDMGKESASKDDSPATNMEDLLNKIREKDSGDGADIEEVIKGFNQGDKMINSLLEEGEIFEIKPGKVKVLE